jgi:prepilin-type N-terminal cleavage/methylation domain-containing protein
MSYRKDKRGLTLTELIVVMGIMSGLLVTVYVFTSSTISSFMQLQAEGLARSKLADGSFRLTKVLRGIDYIESANSDTITAYSYFAPNDQYTSKIRYYLNGPQDKLLAEVTPMTADYPIGTLLTAQTRTVTVIDNFVKLAGEPTFKYYDSVLNELTSPVSDASAIKNISVNLFVKRYKEVPTKYVSTDVMVNLRNRKTNL